MAISTVEILNRGMRCLTEQMGIVEAEHFISAISAAFASTASFRSSPTYPKAFSLIKSKIVLRRISNGFLLHSYLSGDKYCWDFEPGNEMLNGTDGYCWSGAFYFCNYSRKIWTLPLKWKRKKQKCPFYQHFRLSKKFRKNPAGDSAWRHGGCA